VFRSIICFFAAAVVLWTGISIAQENNAFNANRHKKRGVACLACHGEATPKTAASEKGCLSCHKSLEAVAEKTIDMTPANPHKNHITEANKIECTQCHNGHKADVPSCTNCHAGMNFEKKAKS
jgi:fumarate reductase flavoprotein subunit